MQIGKEKRTIIIEPIEEPTWIPIIEPAPAPLPVEEPEPMTVEK